MNLLPEALKSMSPSELLSENERLLEVVRQQQQQIQAQQAVIERLESQVAQQGERIKQLEEELRAQKKLDLLHISRSISANSQKAQNNENQDIRNLETS